MPTSPTLAPAEQAIGRDDVAETEGLNFDVRGASLNGTAFTNALLLYNIYNNGRVEINLGRSKAHFKGDLGITDDSKSASAFKVDISMDNSAPVLSFEVHFGETKPLDLDVNGVLRLKFVISPVNPTGGILAIGNPRTT